MQEMLETKRMRKVTWPVLAGGATEIVHINGL